MPLPWPGVTGQHTPLLPGHLHHPYQADGMRNEDCGFKCSTLQASQLACSLPLPNPAAWQVLNLYLPPQNHQHFGTISVPSSIRPWNPQHPTIQSQDHVSLQHLGPLERFLSEWLLCHLAKMVLHHQEWLTEKSKLSYLASVILTNALFQIAGALPWQAKLQTDLPCSGGKSVWWCRLWRDCCPGASAATPSAAATTTAAAASAWQPAAQWASVPPFKPWHKFGPRSWLVRRPGWGQDYQPGPGSVPGPWWDFKWWGGREAHFA